MSGGDWKEMFQGVQENDLALVEYHLRTGIDPNYQHPEFLALPLAESIRYNHLEITALLLENGADPKIIETESGISTLEIARKREYQKALDLMKKYLQ